MTKKQFLKKLEKELGVLEEKEIKDIIDEYSDIIEEKVKHGKTEKEAVAEVGNVENLAKDILSAYKINPNYKKDDIEELKDSAKKLGEDFDAFIKKGAKKATEVTKDVMDNMKQNNQELTVEFIFELLFKAIVALVIMAIATIPFMMIRSLGSCVLDMMVFPFNSIMGFCWTIVVAVLYILCCGFIFLAVFKQYFVRPNESAKKKERVVSKNEMKQTSSKIVEATEKQVASQDKTSSDSKGKSSSNVFTEVILALVKVFVILMSIPLMCWIFGVGVAIAVIIYLITIGLPIYSILVIAIGVFIFFTAILNVVFSIISHHNRIHVWPFLVGLLMILVGGLMTFDYALKFEYEDNLPKDMYHQTEKVFIEEIPETPYKIYIGDHHHNLSVHVDDNLPVNQMKVVVKYYDEIVEMESDQLIKDSNCYDYHTNNFECGNIYRVPMKYQNGWNAYRNMRTKVLHHLRKHKVYNYSDLKNIEIDLYVNSVNQDRIMN